MTAGNINGSLTGIFFKHKLVRPAEGEACGFRGVSGCSCSSLINSRCILDIRDSAYHSHRTAAIDIASHVAAIDVDHGVSAHHARLRVVIFLAIITSIGVSTATSAIDVASVASVLRILVLISEVPPGICRLSARNLIYNTYGAAIDIHLGAVGVMTILAAAIDRTLDEWGSVNRARTFRTDIHH